MAHLKATRLLLAYFFGVTAAHAFAGSAGAGNFPQKPLRIIVSSAPGGGQDLTVRPIAQQLAEQLGVAVVVDNRGGASGVIAMDLTRQSAPDGYTLLAGATSIILMGVTGKVSYDMRKAFDPVAHLTSQPYLFVAHPSLPARTPKEFIAFAKTRPGVLTYGTSGPGSLHNLGMELLQSITGTKLVHVPYKGSGPALVDLLAGQINLMFTSTTSGAAHVRSGKLRALAITSRNRIAAYPDIPTLSETVAPGYELGNIYYLLAPAGTPQPVLKTLNAEISRILNLPQIRDKFVAEGVTPILSQTIEQFRDEYLREIDRWQQFTKRAKLQLN
jgi:tripartite-type tricarboxylate transporter receptor subunit TctC